MEVTDEEKNEAGSTGSRQASIINMIKRRFILPS